MRTIISFFFILTMVTGCDAEQTVVYGIKIGGSTKEIKNFDRFVLEKQYDYKGYSEYSNGRTYKGLEENDPLTYIVVIDGNVEAVVVHAYVSDFSKADAAIARMSSTFGEPTHDESKNLRSGDEILTMQASFPPKGKASKVTFNAGRNGDTVQINEYYTTEKYHKVTYELEDWLMKKYK